MNDVTSADAKFSKPFLLFLAALVGIVVLLFYFKTPDVPPAPILADAADIENLVGACGPMDVTFTSEKLSTITYEESVTARTKCDLMAKAALKIAVIREVAHDGVIAKKLGSP